MDGQRLLRRCRALRLPLFMRAALKRGNMALGKLSGDVMCGAAAARYASSPCR